MRQFFRNEDGVAAIEFALVAVPFLTLLIGIIELGTKSLIQTELDRLAFGLTMQLAREDDATVSRADYKANILCAQSSPLIDCNKIIMGAEAFGNTAFLDGIIHDVFADNWNTGCEGATVVTELLYPVKNIMIPYAVADIIEHEGENYYRARGMIRREPLLIGNKGGTAAWGSGAPC